MQIYRGFPGEGHCGLPLDQLGGAAAKLLEVEISLILPAIKAEIDAGTVISDQARGQTCVFLAGLHRAEIEVAERLRLLAKGRPPWPEIDPERAIPWVEEKTGVSLAESQQAAIGLLEKLRRNFAKGNRLGRL